MGRKVPKKANDRRVKTPQRLFRFNPKSEITLEIRTFKDKERQPTLY